MSRNEKLASLSNKIPERLTKAEMVNYSDKIKERDNTMVTGVFRNLKNPGESIKDVPFRIHKGPINKYTMHDGGIYTVPYAFAYHIEHKCNDYIFKRGKGIPGSQLLNSNGIAMGAGTAGMEGGDVSIEYAVPIYSFLSTDVPQRSGIITRR